MASHSAGLFWLHTLGFFSLTRPSRDAYAVSALVRGTAGSGVACVVASSSKFESVHAQNTPARLTATAICALVAAACDE